MRKGRAAILGAWCGYSRLVSCGAWHVTCSCRWAEAVRAAARVALQCSGVIQMARDGRRQVGVGRIGVGTVTVMTLS